MQPREMQVHRTREQAPPDLPIKREPITLTNVHRVERAQPLSVRTLRATPVRPAASRRVRFREWRRAHYVADQAMRVVAILVGGALAFAIVLHLLVWALVALIGPILGTLASIAGGVVAVAVILWIASLFGGGDGHKDGWGFHWSRCK